MQVTCPNCRARYAVDPLAIGPSGRTVQCARCNDRWFQTVKVEPTPNPPPVAEEPKPEPPPKPRAMPWLPFNLPFGKGDAEAKDDPKVDPKPEPRVGPRTEPNFDTRPTPAPRPPAPEPVAVDTAPVPDFVIRPPTRGSGLPALIEPKASRRISLVLVGALVLLVLLLVGVLAFHNVIVDQLPAEWRSILRFDA